MPTTTSTRPSAPLATFEPVSIAEDVAGATFSRTLVTGVVYGLVGWFHLVLIPAYTFSGLVGADALDAYPVGPWVWAGAYVATGLLMLAVALGLVNGRGWAWRWAPWAVLPNVAVHAVFFTVLPLWGVLAVLCDLLVAAVVVRERSRYRAVLAAATVAARFPHHPAARTVAPSSGNRRAT